MPEQTTQSILDQFFALFFFFMVHGGAAVLLFVLGVALYLHRTYRPKYFYFVRHGETLLNEQHIRQGAEGKLSERGRVEAKRVGIFLKGKQVKKIIASPFERTVETASIINTDIQAPIAYSSLFQEKRNPSEIIGKSYYDPSNLAFRNKIEISYHDDDARFSDEENFIELKQRAQACLDFLESQKEASVCIVTHQNFLKILLACMLLGTNIHVPEFVHLNFFTQANNGGLTLCVYKPYKKLWKQNPWELVYFNNEAITYY